MPASIPNVVLTPLVSGIMPPAPMPIEFPISQIVAWLVVLLGLAVACAALYFFTRLTPPLRRERHLRILRPNTTAHPVAGQA